MQPDGGGFSFHWRGRLGILAHAVFFLDVMYLLRFEGSSTSKRGDAVIRYQLGLCLIST